MPDLSSHDFEQMDPEWVNSQPESVVRGLLQRALDELRLMRGLTGPTQRSGGAGGVADDALVPAAADGRSEPEASRSAWSSGEGRPG